MNAKHTSNKEDIGKRLRHARTISRVSQKKAAEVLGITQANLSLLERGQSII